MRNTTKLKQILLKYTIDLSMDDDGLMQLTLVDKQDGTMQSFEHNAYSTLISKAYSYMMKQLKDVTTRSKPLENRRNIRSNKELE